MRRTRDIPTRALAVVATARIAIGVGALAAPRLARAAFPEAAGSPDGRALVRMVGARDLALGVATLLCLRAGTAVGTVALATVLSDGSDAVAALGTSALPLTRAATVVSGLLGAAVTTVAVLARRPHPTGARAAT